MSGERIVHKHEVGVEFADGMDRESRFYRGSAISSIRLFSFPDESLR